MITVGNNEAKGVSTFFLMQKHHTELPNRYLIPSVEARTLVTDWLQTKVRPISVEWEEV